LTSRLGSIRLELTDIAGEISAARGPQDSEGLAQVQERLSVLAHLRRKFGDTESEILAHLAKACGRLDELRSAEDAATDFELKSKEAWGRAVEIAARLTASRRAAAPLLIEAVQERLADLALGGALLEIELTPSPLSEHGAEEVSLLVSANPGERPKPIGKIASGGELSRISLALHLLLTQADAASTMVFDEVDAGVGGTAAQSIGRALAELGHRGGMQVLVVTHLPQVAAFTDNHLKVEKETLDGSTRAKVMPVQGDERILELSRMLAGLPESELGQEHARELLAVAGSGTRKE
jgi:DNA repair protein RecN (Recombination protein N)